MEVDNTMIYDRPYALKSRRFSLTPEWGREVRNLWFECIKLPRNSTVLDLGCNTGGLLRKIREKRPDLLLIGIDINVAGLQQAKKRDQESKFFTDLKHIESNSVDYIMSMHSLPHFKSRIAVTASMKRVLKPHGKLGVIVNNKNNRRLWWIPNLFNNYKHDQTIQVDYNRRSLVKFLNSRGFEVTRSKTFSNNGKLWWFKSLAPRVFYIGTLR